MIFYGIAGNFARSMNLNMAVSNLATTEAVPYVSSVC